MVVLVDQRLGGGGVGGGFRHRHNTGGDDIAVGVGGLDVLQKLLVVGQEGGNIGAGGGIGAAQRHDDAAGLHFSNGLQQRVGVGVLLKVDAAFASHLRDQKPVLADVLVQGDAAVLREGDRRLVTGKHAGGDVAVVSGGGTQHGGQAGVQRVGIGVVAALFAARGRLCQKRSGDDADNKSRRTGCQHDAGLALRGAEFCQTAGVVVTHGTVTS